MFYNKKIAMNCVWFKMSMFVTRYKILPCNAYAITLISIIVVYVCKVYNVFGNKYCHAATTNVNFTIVYKGLLKVLNIIYCTS